VISRPNREKKKIENKILVRIFESKREEVTGAWGGDYTMIYDLHTNYY
jgi:hypothetical protein